MKKIIMVMALSLGLMSSTVFANTIRLHMLGNFQGYVLFVSLDHKEVATWGIHDNRMLTLHPKKAEGTISVKMLSRYDNRVCVYEGKKPYKSGETLTFKNDFKLKRCGDE